MKPSFHILAPYITNKAAISHTSVVIIELDLVYNNDCSDSIDSLTCPYGMGKQLDSSNPLLMYPSHVSSL